MPKPNGQPGIANASSFTDLAAAEAETSANIGAHGPGINFWLTNMNHPRMTIESPMLDPTHAVVYGRDAASWGPGRSVVTVLQRDGAMPDGYSIFTSYANP